ncbi:MAG: hypothetical protein A2V60_03400 [Candidatus Portnoybacteria bacterium RIFCSPHIGHO2_01_FULL_39_19]|nr:MAG: hypothetical protein A2V60_03400 [Candidatus Portnoybacteria bacterium RIFCSPHIGHO2_01_FULL_39_19]
MGVYDFLKGPCPYCGAEIGKDCGDVQIKWFWDPDPELSCSFRTFRPGDTFPKPVPNGLYPLGDWGGCCGTRDPLYAVVVGNTFRGFVRGSLRDALGEVVQVLVRRNDPY